MNQTDAGKEAAERTSARAPDCPPTSAGTHLTREEVVESEPTGGSGGPAGTAATSTAEPESTLARIAHESLSFFLGPHPYALADPTSESATDTVARQSGEEGGKVTPTPPRTREGPREKMVHALLLGDRGSGRSTLARSLTSFGEKRRLRGTRVESMERELLLLGTGLGSHSHVECEVARSGTSHTSMGRPARVAASLTVVDPGPVDLDKSVGCLLPVVGANLVMCILPLVGVKQVRQRSGGDGVMSAVYSFFGTESAADVSARILLHTDDVARLRTMLRLANSLAPRTIHGCGVGPPPTVVFVGSFMDTLTENSVAATRAVLDKLADLISAITRTDNLTVSVHHLFAVDLAHGTCVAKDDCLAVPGTSRFGATDDADPAQQQGYAGLSRLWEFLCTRAAPDSSSGGAVGNHSLAASSDAESASDRALLQIIRSFRHRRSGVPSVLKVDQLRSVAFALGCTDTDVALTRVLSTLCCRGELMRRHGTTTTTTHVAAARGGALVLYPAQYVSLLAFLEVWFGAAQGLRTFHDEAVAVLFQSLSGNEVALLRGGFMPCAGLDAIGELLWSATSTTATTRTTTSSSDTADMPAASSAGGEECSPTLSAYIAFSGLGVSCKVRLDGHTSPTNGFLFPPFIPKDSVCPKEAVDMARLLVTASGSAHGCATGAKGASCAMSTSTLSLSLSSAPPPHLFALLTCATGHLVVGTAFADAVWLRPKGNGTNGTVVRALLHFSTTAKGGGLGALDVTVFALGNSAAATVDGALFEKEVLDCMGYAIADLLPRSGGVLSTDVAESLHGPSPQELSDFSYPHALKQLDSIFMEAWHGFTVI